MTRLFFRDTEQTPILSRFTGLRIGLLLGPAIFVLMLLRLIEHAMLAVVGQPRVGDLLLGPAPP